LKIYQYLMKILYTKEQVIISNTNNKDENITKNIKIAVNKL